MKLIKNERNGQVINRSLVRSVIQIILDMGNDKEDSNKSLYVENIEEPFLLETQKYYNEKCQSLVNIIDSTTYMKQINRRKKCWFVQQQQKQVMGHTQ